MAHEQGIGVLEAVEHQVVMNPSDGQLALAHVAGRADHGST